MIINLSAIDPCIFGGMLLINELCISTTPSINNGLVMSRLSMRFGFIDVSVVQWQN